MAQPMQRQMTQQEYQQHQQRLYAQQLQGGAAPRKGGNDKDKGCSVLLWILGAFVFLIIIVAVIWFFFCNNCGRRGGECNEIRRC
jgi:hypothetical protein